VSRGAGIRLPTSPKSTEAGSEYTDPALGRVARGLGVITDRLDEPMSADIPHLHLPARRSPADSDCVRRLLLEWRDGLLTRAECLDGIEAVNRFGSTQPGLF